MKTWNNTDKSKWENGPWMNEPDKAQWVAHGLDCLIVRGPSGALCGYVGVPESHKYFDADYADVDVEAHGGLTFGDRCRPHDEGEHKGICHIEEGAANKTVFWLGFDCAHSWDLVPGLSRDYILLDDDVVYRDFYYVKRETERLARQLSSVEGNEHE